MSDDAARRPAVEALPVRITVGSALLVVAAVAASTVVIDLFTATRRILGWALATLIVAWLAWSIIALFDRWIPRGMAVIATVLLLVLVAAGTWAGVVGAVRVEVDRIRTDLPEAAHNLERRYEVAAEFRLAERVQAFVDDLNERFSTRRQVSRVAETAPTYFVTGILMLFFVGYGSRFASGALNQIANPAHRERVAAVVGRASARARAYILLTIGQVIVTILVTSGVFYLLGLRAPFLLGLIVGLLGAVPYIGFAVGGLAPLLAAAADRDEVAFIAVLVLVVVLQSIEAFVVRRKVDPRTLQVGPALMLIVAMISFELYGLGGAVYGCVALVFTLAVLDAIAATRDGPDATASPTAVAG